MTSVEMVRMSAQDKKLSNPSKSSGNKAADFSQLINEKAADTKKAESPPDEKVQEKAGSEKTKSEKETDADSDELQALKLYQDFAARLEWEINQPVPVYEEPSLKEETPAPVPEVLNVQEGNPVENENPVVILAESQPDPEKAADPKNVPVTEPETERPEIVEHMGAAAVKAEKTEKAEKEETVQKAGVPQPEKTEAKQSVRIPQVQKTGEETGEKTGEKMMEDFRPPQGELTRQEAEGAVTADRKMDGSDRATQAGSKSGKEASKQVQPASEQEGIERPENIGFQTAKPIEAAKTAETARPTEAVHTTRQELSTDVGKTIASRMPIKNGEMVIELEPASLGKIVVRATYDAGRASVELMTANSKTLEILSRDAGNIAMIIEEKTGRETVVFVPQQEAYPEESGRERGSNGREPRQQNDRKKQQSESFLQQIRLGLV